MPPIACGRWKATTMPSPAFCVVLLRHIVSAFPSTIACAPRPGAPVIFQRVLGRRRAGTCALAARRGTPRFSTS